MPESDAPITVGPTLTVPLVLVHRERYDLLLRVAELAEYDTIERLDDGRLRVDGGSFGVDIQPIGDSLWLQDECGAEMTIHKSIARAVALAMLMAMAMEEGWR